MGALWRRWESWLLAQGQVWGPQGRPHPDSQWFLSLGWWPALSPPPHAGAAPGLNGLPGPPGSGLALAFVLDRLKRKGWPGARLHPGRAEGSSPVAAEEEMRPWDLGGGSPGLPILGVLCRSRRLLRWAGLGAQSWKEPRGKYLRLGAIGLRPSPSPLPGELGTTPDSRPACRCGHEPGRLTVFVQTGGGPARAPGRGQDQWRGRGWGGRRTVCAAPAAALKENAPSPSSETSRAQEH